MSTSPGCSDDPERRRAARRAGLNGLTAVDVTSDAETLLLSFLQEAPRLRPENVRIDGGRSVTDLLATGVQPIGGEDEESLRVTLNRRGDSSTYVLRLVRSDAHSQPGDKPIPGFDPLLTSRSFRFATDDSSGVDCLPAPGDATENFPEPVLDYLAKDYAGFRQLLLDRLTLTAPQWRERHVPDLQMTLVELLAYVGDYLSYRQDAVAAEAYLSIARQRISVRRHARLIDYPMHDGCNARAWVCLQVVEPFTLPTGSFCFATRRRDGPDWHTPVIDVGQLQAAAALTADAFEPVWPGDITLSPAHNEISFWTWGRSRAELPAGATAATLRDSAERADPADAAPARVLQLRAGDVLVLEEIRGPQTGKEADRDAGRRWPVRLTEVRESDDPVFNQPVLEVRWADEDALPFPLCLTTLHPLDEQETVREVTVARGNTVLTDHGATRSSVLGALDRERVTDARPAGEQPTEPVPAASRATAPRWSLPLTTGPVTWTTGYPRPVPLGRRQARVLDRLPEKVARRLLSIARQATAGQRLADSELGELFTLFGPRQLVAAELVDRHDPTRPRDLTAQEQAERLQRLLTGVDRLLAGKCRRLHQLAARARAGVPLPASDLDEVTALFGFRYTEGLRNHSVLLGPAAEAAQIDPRDALPAVTVTVMTPPSAGEPVTGQRWRVVRDLLDSGTNDRDVVVEVDNEGLARLRFGDGRTGQALEVGSTVVADYRIGNGTTGNAGAETIAHLVMLHGTAGGEVTTVRNPLPAAGGTDPEPLAEVRALAPGQPRTVPVRAVTATDYATLAGSVAGVQRAAATLRWTGTAYEARVAVDPFGQEQLDSALRDEVTRTLNQFRRLGHELVVQHATNVPLDVTLRIEIAPGADARQVSGAVIQTFSSRTLPAGRRGFFHPDNLTFGARIAVSRIVAAACAIPGVSDAEVTRLRRWPEGDHGELAVGVLALRPLEIPRVDSDGEPDHGWFRLQGRGHHIGRAPRPTPQRGGEPPPNNPPPRPLAAPPGTLTAPSLIRIDGDVSTRYLLTADVTTIGRGSDMVIRVAPEAEAVSRRHAQFIRRGAKVDVEDIGSSNGTWVNGHRVEQARLTDGDEIGIGELGLRFQAAGGSALPGEADPAPSKPEAGDRG